MRLEDPALVSLYETWGPGTSELVWAKLTCVSCVIFLLQIAWLHDDCELCVQNWVIDWALCCLCSAQILDVDVWAYGCWVRRVLFWNEIQKVSAGSTVVCHFIACLSAFIQHHVIKKWVDLWSLAVLPVCICTVAVPCPWKNLLWLPYGIEQAIIFLPCGFFFYLLFFRRLISAIAEWMPTILLHMVWP